MPGVPRQASGGTTGSQYAAGRVAREWLCHERLDQERRGPDQLFFSDWPMISRAVKPTLQSGNSLPTKKLSDRSE